LTAVFDFLQNADRISIPDARMMRAMPDVHQAAARVLSTGFPAAAMGGCPVGGPGAPFLAARGIVVV